ncbi:MAG TPA: hypothetical protein VEQ65_06385, partial [Opitutus sp.]|nr:hypothetical protein [Opitutus sp.]
MKPSVRSQASLLLGALSLLLLAGCATYQQQATEFTQSTKSGSFAAAVATIDKKAEAAKGTKDEIVWRLEQGLSLRSAAMADPAVVAPPPPAPVAAPQSGQEPAPAPAAAPTPEEIRAYYLQRSLAAFDAAEERVNRFEEEAKTKVGSEVGAAFTNQAALPYRGRAYDKVMMNTYKALNHLAAGNRDNVRLELNRSLQRQRDAVAENEKRIAEAQEVAAKAKSGEADAGDGKKAAYDTDEALADGRTGPALQAALDESLAPMKPYGDYVNPFSVFLDGLFFSAVGENGSDWERGRKSLERVASIVPENPYLKDDLTMASQAAEGKSVEGVTYVIFETGSAPARDQVRIDIPTFLVTSKLAYVGASFPKLKFSEDYVATLGVGCSGGTFSTATIASMDSIIANDFKNEWPTIVTKTLITTATKAIVQAATQKVAEDRGGMWGGLAAGLIMGAINSA